MKIKKYGGMSMVKLVVLCTLLRCYHAIYDMKRNIDITVLTSCIWIFSGFYLLKEVAKFKIPSEFMICTVAMQYLNIYIYIFEKLFRSQLFFIIQKILHLHTKNLLQSVCFFLWKYPGLWRSQDLNEISWRLSFVSYFSWHLWIAKRIHWFGYHYIEWNLPEEPFKKLILLLNSPEGGGEPDPIPNLYQTT